MQATAITAVETEGPEQLLGRVEDLQTQLEQSPHPDTRQLAEELVSSIVHVYGSGLKVILDALSAAGEPGEQIAAGLAEDPLVATLLLIHDLHPVPLEDRVHAALEQVRPYMESHGGNVELLSLEQGVARIKLEGTCSSCSASSVTLELAIKRALEELAPDLEGLDVDGIAQQPDGIAPRPDGMVSEADGAIALPMLDESPPSVLNGHVSTALDDSPLTCIELPVIDTQPPHSGRATQDSETCDVCGVSIPEDHRHLLHLTERRIVCTCESCWGMRSGEGDYRPTGTRTLWLADLDLPEDLWASFQIPIGLTFFMRSTVTECVVAMYPSPAGATESELHFESWERMCELNPPLAGMDADIEGLIVNRLAEPPVYAIAPIDKCYELTGLVKTSWEGLSGGARVQEAVTEFFERLHAEAVKA